jgi:hypothetical protein
MKGNSKTPPNILFIMTDSWDGRKAGYMGQFPVNGGRVDSGMIGAWETPGPTRSL